MIGQILQFRDFGTLYEYIFFFFFFYYAQTDRLM